MTDTNNITNRDIEEATFKAGYAFAQTGLDMNTAWEKFCEVNDQLKKNTLEHGEEVNFTPEEIEMMKSQEVEEL